MIRSCHVAVLSLLVASCAPSSLAVSKPTVPTHDASSHAGSGSDAPEGDREKAHVTILSYRTTVTVNEDGTFVRRFERRYSIDDQTALRSDWTSTGAYWSPWRQARPVIEVSVVSKDGSVHHLDPATIEEAAAHEGDASMYSDARTLRAPIPNLDVGAIVTEVVTTRSTRPLAPKAAGGLEGVGDLVGSQATEVTVDVPELMPFTWKLLGDQATAKESRAAGRRKVTVTRAAYSAPTKLYDGVPDDVWQAPHLLWGTATSWASLATYYATVSEAALASADLTAIARSVVAPGDDAATQARKLTSYVREHVRYVGLELGQSAIVPHTPTETLTRKYGDCKDQALLLAGLLRAVGANASVALVTTGRVFAPEVPMFEAFDHAIVHVAGKTPLWIDPTDVGEPGVLSPDLEGDYALLARSDTTALVRMPESAASANVYKETREIYLPSEGPARLLETASGDGQVDRGLRGDYADPAALTHDTATKYVEKFYGAKKVGAYGVTKVDDLFQAVEARHEAIDTPRGFSNDTLSEAIVEDDVLYGTLQNGIFTDEARPYGVKIGYAETRVLDVIAHSAAPFEAEDVPAGETVALGPVTLTRAFEKRGPHELRAHYTLVMPSRRFSKDEVKALRTALADYVKRPAARLRFPRRAATLEAAGKTVEALALLRADLAAKDAAYVEGRRLVAFLWRMRFTDEAHRTAEALTQRFPDSGEPVALLGAAALHDRLGRIQGIDVNYRTALPLFERAHAKDPTSTRFRDDLAEAVRMDPWGRPAFERAHIDQAVGLLSDPKTEPTDTEAVSAGFLLARSGRYSEVSAYIPKMPDPSMRASYELLVAAATGHGEGLTAAVARLPGGDKEHADAVEKATNVAAAIGAYGPAVVLREAYEKRATAKPDPETMAEFVAMRDGIPGESPLERQVGEQLCDLGALITTGRRRDGGVGMTEADESVAAALRRATGDLSTVAYLSGVDVVCTVGRGSVRVRKVRDVGTMAEVRLEVFPSAKLLLNVLVTPGDTKDPFLMTSSLGEREAARVVRADLARAGEAHARALLGWFFSFRESVGGIPTGSPGVVVWNTTHDVALTLAAMDSWHDAASVGLLLKVLPTNEDRSFQIAVNSAIWATVFHRAADELPAALDRLEGLGAPPPVLRVSRLRWLGQRGGRAEIERILSSTTIPSAARATGYAAAADGYFHGGKLPEALELFERAHALGPFSDFEANQALWCAVLAGKTDLPWLKDVATGLAATDEPARLHTLASYYAAVGDSAEAKTKLDAYVAKLGPRAAHASSYLPIALLAEKHGLRSTAIELLTPMTADSEETNLRAFAKSRIAKLKTLGSSEP